MSEELLTQGEDLRLAEDLNPERSRRLKISGSDVNSLEKNDQN
jgi:hypothetical protein